MPMAEAENIQLVKDSYAALFRGDMPAFLDMLADDFTLVMPGPADVPLAGTFRGKQAVADWFAVIGQHFDGKGVDFQAYIAQGDTVVVLLHEETVLRRTGRLCVDDEAHVMTIRDGQLVHWREYYDTAAYAAAYREE